MCVEGRRSMWEISMCSTQFFCESKIALKKQILFKKLTVTNLKI
jgi:hypothetical protein